MLAYRYIANTSDLHIHLRKQNILLEVSDLTPSVDTGMTRLRSVRTSHTGQQQAEKTSWSRTYSVPRSSESKIECVLRTLRLDIDLIECTLVPETFHLVEWIARNDHAVSRRHCDHTDADSQKQQNLACRNSVYLWVQCSCDCMRIRSTSVLGSYLLAILCCARCVTHPFCVCTYLSSHHSLTPGNNKSSPCLSVMFNAFSLAGQLPGQCYPTDMPTFCPRLHPCIWS